MLFYTEDQSVTPKMVIKTCKENRCDGLFNFDRKYKIMRYFDCDGTPNYCGNAARSLPLVLGVSRVRFSVKVGNRLIPSFSWRDKEGLFATTIKVQKFKEERAGDLYWAFVGNFQKIKISSSEEFRLAKENAKKWAKMEKKRPPIYSFVLVECEEKAKVRVIEEFGEETASCCSSASAVTKVMNTLYPQRNNFVLQYPGGTFFTRLHNARTPSFVTLKGKCEICWS
jgi:diaminopimelate epimerase